ncbi:MAG: hypothetical protein IJU29_08320, partial [Oscillospiraceae bacterium]|nr:hypothetical protein [Oscillospiraceae bacterium]
LMKSTWALWRANFVSAKAQKPQEYFVYFKVFATQAGAKFAAKRARGFIQRFLNYNTIQDKTPQVFSRLAPLSRLCYNFPKSRGEGSV